MLQLGAILSYSLLKYRSNNIIKKVNDSKIQKELAILIKAELFPFQPLVLVSAMSAQITEKNSYKLKLPLQIVQLYLLTIALGIQSFDIIIHVLPFLLSINIEGIYYCYDIAHESREYKKRQNNFTPTFVERIQYDTII
jgi:hypothetical protein